MALLRGKKIVFKAFAKEIFPFPTENYSKQSEQSEQLERPKWSRNYYQYISPESNNSDISNSASQINGFSDSGYLLVTLNYTKSWNRTKILTLRQMLQRLTIALAQVNAGNTPDMQKSLILCIKQKKLLKSI